MNIALNIKKKSQSLNFQVSSRYHAHFLRKAFLNRERHGKSLNFIEICRKNMMIRVLKLFHLFVSLGFLSNASSIFLVFYLESSCLCYPHAPRSTSPSFNLSDPNHPILKPPCQSSNSFSSLLSVSSSVYLAGCCLHFFYFVQFLNFLR